MQLPNYIQTQENCKKTEKMLALFSAIETAISENLDINFSFGAIKIEIHIRDGSPSRVTTSFERSLLL